MADTATKTGMLIDIGMRQYGACTKYRFYECIDCKSRYPVLNYEDARAAGYTNSDYNNVSPCCNGRTITHCPYCKPQQKE